MHQLEEASLFTRSGITGLADRLEQAGTDKIDEVWPDHQFASKSTSESTSTPKAQKRYMPPPKKSSTPPPSNT